MKTCKQKVSRKVIEIINEEYNSFRSLNRCGEVKSLRERLHIYLLKYHKESYVTHLQKNIPEKVNQKSYTKRKRVYKVKTFGRCKTPIHVTLFSDSVSFINSLHSDKLTNSNYVQSFLNCIRIEFGLLNTEREPINESEY